MKVLFDTCALISLVSGDAIYHEVAQQCFEELVRKKHRVYISALTLAEYSVRGDPSDVYKLPFRIPSFGVPHAEKAAEFRKVTGDKSKVARMKSHDRQFISVDTMILAQAVIENVDYILTLDHHTFARAAQALVDAGFRLPQIVLLDDDPLSHLQVTAQQNPSAQS